MSVLDWFVGQTTTWITLVCAVIILGGMFIIGGDKRRRRNQDR